MAFAFGKALRANGGGRIRITPGHSVPDAARLLRQRGVRRLPVTDGSRPVGIVTDRGLREVSTRLAGITVADDAGQEAAS
ncbi:CBS domain-containing protein [Deinococcus sp. YIM 77859]|uniref:CBS domain-containing protein n=1 Tax=Deinococcus sp. YIM 77859 TaxID=1540221 RepID=UPI00055048C8|nr:CBS domain-containing protein [Deinococcus sp. YIM 77859]